jgi:hypothetical protein
MPVRLALAFHNTFGGLIVFGVKDRILSITGVAGPFEIETFNAALSAFTNVQIECLTKLYVPPNSGNKVSVVRPSPEAGPADGPSSPSD